MYKLYPSEIDMYEGLGFNVRLLLFLLENGRIKRSEVKKEFNYYSAKAALEDFASVGLTEYEAVGDHRDTVYWSLTEKGTKVARTLRDLDDFIRSE